MLIRLLAENFRSPGSAFRVRETLPLKGRAHAQSYRLNYVYGSYREHEGSPLRALAVAKVERVTVEFDRRDIRVLTVLDEGGSPIGKVRVLGEWARFPHDAALRRAVCRLARDKRFARQHPLIDYWVHLSERLDRPSEALRLFDIYQRICGPDRGAPPTAGTDAAHTGAPDKAIEWKPWSVPNG